MANYTGVVSAVVVRTVNTKFGAKPVYDLTMDSGKRVSWGFKKPPFTDGAEISFDYEEDKFGWKAVVETHEVLKDGDGSAPKPAASKPVATAAASGGGWKDVGFPVPVMSEKISIIRQNALTNARELYTWGAETSSEGASVAQLEKMAGEIIEIAKLFADYTSGRDVMDKLEKLASSMEGAKKKK